MFRAHQVAAEPAEVVGDPREHRNLKGLSLYVLLLLLLLLPAPARLAQPGELRRRELVASRRPHARAVFAREHPGVLRAAALGAVHDHRPLAQSHAREAARHDLDLVAEHRERTQVYVAGRE